MKSRKPIEMKPCTPMTRAIISSGRCFENCATANVHHASIRTHSSIEPSWEPQLAATLYCTGNWELEFVATLSTEKSLLTNDQHEAQVRQRDEERLATRGGARHSHPDTVATGCTGDRQRRLDHCDQQRQDQCEVTNLRNHVLSRYGTLTVF